MPKLPQKLAHIEINLLPQDPFINSLLGKFLTWSLTIGRYLVVMTELIVILSFLSRFSLDRRLTDLNEAIEDQKSIILSYQDTESYFRTIQTKIDFLKRESQNQNSLESLSFLEKNLPLDVKLDTLTLQPSGWSLTASALSAQGMKTTIDRVISINPQSTISLGSLKFNSRTGAIDFDISVRVQQKVNPANKKETI